MYFQEDLVPLSALQHYIFCPRQCALNYVEKVWIENYLTAAGRLLHKKTEEYFRETRSDTVLEFGPELYSKEFKLFGQADVVEYQYSSDKKENLRRIIPIEYKKGKIKDNDSDIVQLCGQALCLMEMSGLKIEYGYLFYFGTRSRVRVNFSKEIIDTTIECINSVHQLFIDNKTPDAVYSKSCNSCSMIDICWPKTLGRGKSVQRYLGQMIKEESDI